MFTGENIGPHLSHPGVPWGHSTLAHYDSVLLWASALASPFLNRCCVSCLLGMGAVVWLPTSILLRVSGLRRSLGNAHQPFRLSKPCSAPSAESGKFILVPKQNHSDPGPTWNPSLKFPIWWTAAVSNLLNQFATLLRSCVSDHESRLTWPVRGLVRLHGETALIRMFLFVCASLQCCLPGWILWCRHLCKYSLTCMSPSLPPGVILYTSLLWTQWGQIASSWSTRSSHHSVSFKVIVSSKDTRLALWGELMAWTWSPLEQINTTASIRKGGFSLLPN